MLKKIIRHRHFILIFFLAIIAYTLFFEFNRIFPSNINWLFKERGDWGQHYLGWAFFKNQEWQFPLGEISNYSYPSGTNIVFTDSIPLLAIFFKVFKFLLPENFQFLGLWLFICTFLNGFFSFKLLRHYKVSLLFSYVFVFLIMINPVFMFRASHAALYVHWFIIGSVYYFVSIQNGIDYLRNFKKVLLFFIISGLISPYFTLFLAGFISIFLVLNFIKKYISIYKTILLVFVSAAIELFLLYSVGAIGGGEKLGGEGNYNMFGMNLNSLFNSRGFASLIDGFPVYREQQFEGFMYLGAGFIALIIIVLILFIFNFTNKKRLLSKKYILLFVLTILFSIFSISHEVTYNNILLFTIPLMEKISPLANVFRASGRFFWLAYYILLFFSIITLYKAQVHKYLKVGILFFVLGTQLYDCQKFFVDKGYEIGDYVPDLDNKSWSTLFKKHKHVVTLPLYLNSMKRKLDYQEFGYYANKFNTTITSGYSARSRKDKQQEYKNIIFKKLANGNIDTNTLYISTEEMLPYFYKLFSEGKITVNSIDNYYAIYSSQKQISLDKLKGEHKDAKNKILKQNQFTPTSLKIISENKIQFFIENFVKEQSFLEIEGWAFVKGTNNNLQDTIQIVLQNDKRVYKTNTIIKERPDITVAFEVENLDNSGFKLFSVIDDIEEGIYKVFITIKNNRTNKETSILTDKIVHIYYQSDLKIIQHEIFKNDSIFGNIDNFKKIRNNVTLSGWAIYKGIPSDEFKKSILLLNGTNQYIIDVKTTVRKDVTNHFLSQTRKEINYDFSGYEVEFDISDFPKGVYKIGVFIESNTQKGYYVTDKSITIE